MNAVCIQCGTTSIPGQLDGLCLRCVAARLTVSSSPTLSVQKLGDYDILSELGRGGMGVVYLARQASLDRLVAIKVMLAGSHGGEVAERRFEREARAAAQLNHPHIVRILEIGRDAATAFYSMELIEGEDLSERLKRGPVDPRQAAELLAKAARAVHHAHRAGLVHRDVKPSNILIDSNGEPHLTDFGIAMPVEVQGWLTQTGQALGSPNYMAPEQFSGEATPLSDVYSLGTVLFFTLTGRPPFAASKLPDLLKAIQEDLPPSPKRLDASLSADLAVITLKALQKAPSARYASALAFAEDLERWLGGRPILARPASRRTLLAAWCRRNRALAASLVLGLLVAMSGAVGVTWQWRRASHLAEARQRDLYATLLKLASDALARGDLGFAEDELARCPLELRDAAWGISNARARGDQQAVIGNALRTVTDLAYSPTERLIATASQIAPVKLWSAGTPGPITLPGTEFSWSVGFTPDGQTLITADSQVKIWDLKTHRIVRTFAGLSAVLSPDGKRLATCEGHRFIYEGSPGPVSIWNLETGQKLASIDVPTRVVAWSHDGRKLLISDANTSFSFRDGFTGGPIGPIWDSEGPLWSLSFSPDDQVICASGWSRDARIWNLSTEKTKAIRLNHPLATWAAAFSPDGRELAVACSDRCIYIWDTETRRLLKRLQGHRDEVWSLAWQSDSQIISAGRDPRILQWDVRRGDDFQPIVSDTAAYRPIWLEKDKLMVVNHRDRQRVTREVDLNSGKILREHDGMAPGYFDFEHKTAWGWTENFELAALGPTPAGNIRFDDQADMDDLPRILPKIDRVWGPTHDGGFIFWRLSDGHSIDRWKHCFDSPLSAGAMSSDGHYFAWGGHSTELTLADLRSGKRKKLLGHIYEVDSVDFSPDSRLLVSAGVEGKLLLWNTDTGTLQATLGIHATSVGHVAFSPDGRIVAALEPGVGIHLWHVATRSEVDLIPLADQQSNEWLEFSPDGRWLGARTHDGIIHIFKILMRSENG